MKTVLGKNAMATLVAAMLAAAPVAQAAEGEGWDWMVAPYVWGVTVGTDAKTDSAPAGGISTDTAFYEIVDKLDGAFQIHMEGQGDHFGVFTDFTYLGITDQRRRPRFQLETDLDTRLFELAGVWSPGDTRNQGVELFAGLRYIDADITVVLKPENLDFTPTLLDTGRSFSDLMVGARYSWSLSDRWGVVLRADGSFGETDGTWNVSAVAEYKTKRGAWLVGYRHLDIELESERERFHLSMSGPEVGYGFRF